MVRYACGGAARSSRAPSTNSALLNAGVPGGMSVIRAVGSVGSADPETTIGVIATSEGMAAVPARQGTELRED